MVLKEKEAKDKLLSGINQNADIVKKTLGAKGRTVLLIDNLRMSNKITKDGTSISDRIRLDDSVEDAGSKIVQNAARKTLMEAGDGTTTTTILTQDMCNKIVSEINVGKDPNELCKNLKIDLKTVVDYIKSKSKVIETTEQIKQIAMVSSNYDEEISNIIKEIYDKIGFNGAIDVRSSDSVDTTYQIVDGFTIPNTGYITPLFVNNVEKNRVELRDARVLVFNGKIKTLTQEFMELIGENHPSNENIKPLVIMLQDIDDGILGTILAALSQRELKDVVIVQSNLVYQNRADRFKDASIFLGADYSEEKIGGKLGFCERIIIEKDNTSFINGAGNVTKYLKSLKSELKSDTKNIALEKRIFSLESKAAIINIGGKLVDEINERKDRIDDAVLAVKSAIDEGFCAGGSSTYIFARKDVELKTDIMENALISCYKQLMENANKEPFYIMKQITDQKYGFGYNVINNEIENFLEKGIIDSCKVLRVSLENAVHTACTFAMIEAVVE